MATRRPAGKSKRKRNYKAEYQRRKLYGKPRDYKAEYQARKKREIEKAVARDAKKVFGFIPVRDVRHPDPLTYEEFLIDKAKREGKFAWTDEHQFVASLTELGLTPTEAYTLWFSP